MANDPETIARVLGGDALWTMASAYNAAWQVARRHGLNVAACDEIVTAALDVARRRVTAMAGEITGPLPGCPDANRKKTP